MWKGLRRKARKAIERLKKENLEKAAKLKLEKKAEVKKKEEVIKKEPGKKVDEEREKADKALERLRMFVPRDLGTPPIAGRPAIDVYNRRDAYRDIQTILHYLMKKKEDK